ncbi:replication protein A 32 kDa subunit B-like [Lolium perenne]|uniref:replication protein A 32 kDa subunit B-like n=1 Tax=Lolium perenne TaxID=4522 RepID=UPI0021F5BA62|nr:replication protein A 32 kDa subunit B-like [Lolium perenne]
MASLFEPSENSQAKLEVVPNPVFSDPCLMPVTIKQIHDAMAKAGGERIVINHTAITNVRILGRIVGKELSGGKGNFDIEDGTGLINGIYWVDDFVNIDEFTEVQPGDYACVVGRIIYNSNQPVVSAYSVRKITNFDRITHHFLDCIHSFLQLEKLIAYIFRFSGTLEGVCIKVICQVTNTDEATAKALLNDLASIGEIYNTTDENRYKAT